MPAPTELLRYPRDINGALTRAQTHSPHIDILLEERRYANTLDISRTLSERVSVEKIGPETLKHLLRHRNLGELSTFVKRYTGHRLRLQTDSGEGVIREELLRKDIGTSSTVNQLSRDTEGGSCGAWVTERSRVTDDTGEQTLRALGRNDVVAARSSLKAAQNIEDQLRGAARPVDNVVRVTEEGIAGVMIDIHNLRSGSDNGKIGIAHSLRGAAVTNDDNLVLGEGRW
jgi:hypothetical protein